jgi:hypothetical protein
VILDNVFENRSWSDDLSNVSRFEEKRHNSDRDISRFRFGKYVHYVNICM